MTRQQYQASLQSEINNAGLIGNYQIFSVFEIGVITAIQFRTNVTKELLHYLNGRFNYGVTKANDTTIHVNAPTKIT